MEEMDKKIYLDYASSHPVNKKIIDNATTLLSNNYNASSISENGINNLNDIERCCDKLAKIINCNSDELLWTSSASESNSIIINSYRNMYPDRMVYCSSIEHDSIMMASDIFISVDEDGFVKEEELKNIRNSLVCIMLVNNEIFTVQDEIIRRNIDMLHRNGNLVLCDMSAAFGKIYIDIEQLKIDYATISATKVGGIKGCAATFIRSGVPFVQTIYGTQNNKRHGGTYNWTAIRSFEYVLDDISEYKLKDEERSKKSEEFKHYIKRLNFFNYLVKVVGVDIDINGLPDSYYYGINIFVNTKLTSQQLVNLLELNGVTVSAGSACSSYENKPSHVLKAIGLPDDRANRSLRISWGRETSVEKLYKFVDTLKIILEMNK